MPCNTLKSASEFDERGLLNTGSPEPRRQEIIELHAMSFRVCFLGTSDLLAQEEKQASMQPLQVGFSVFKFT